MKNFNVSRLANCDLLSHIDNQCLYGFLQRHSLALQQSGYVPPIRAEEIDYTALAEFFRAYQPSPQNHTFTEAVHLIMAMSSSSMQEVLDDEAQQLGIFFSRTQPNEELAIRIWLSNPQALLRRQLQSAVYARETFKAFSPVVRPEHPVDFPSAEIQQQMADDLNAAFESKPRRRWSDFQVFAYNNNGRIYFAFRRGDPYRLEPSVQENGASGSTTFRPESFDVCRLHPLTGYLEVNSRTLTLSNEYLKVIGRNLFGNEQQYRPAAKYDLNPLRQGPAVLSATLFADRISKITLSEIEYEVPGTQGGIIKLKGFDAFAILHALDNNMSDFEIRKAKFDILFTASAAPRKLTIEVPQSIRLSRTSDLDIVEDWLRSQGFVVVEEEALSRAA